MHIMFRLIALIMMFLSMQAVIAAEVASGSDVQEPANERPATLPPAYPEWSKRPVYGSAVPPPPLGPYMSTGLSGAERGFACCEQRERKVAPSLDNMPWPERRRPPRQWLPEDGRYSFAPDDVANAPAPSQTGGYENWGRQQWQPIRQLPPQGAYRY